MTTRETTAATRLRDPTCHLTVQQSHWLSRFRALNFSRVYV